MKKAISLIQSLMLLFVFGYCVVDMMRPAPLSEPLLGLPVGLDPRAVSLVIENNLTGKELFNGTLAVIMKSPVTMRRLEMSHMTSVVTELHVELGQVVAGQVTIRVLDRRDYKNRYDANRLL